MEKQQETRITDRLWLGGWRDAKRLKDDSSFLIVTVAEDSPVMGDYFYPLSDPGYQPELFAEAASKTIQLLENTDKQILVHCYSGINRSTSVVIAVLMKTQNISLVEAYNTVIELRPFIWPFENHLKSALKFNNLSEEINVINLPFYGGKKHPPRSVLL